MPSTAFIHQGVTRVLFLSSVGGNEAAPTRVAINAGTNLTPALQSMAGFAIDPQMHEAAPVGGAFVEQVPGVNKVSTACTLTLYDNRTSTAIRTAVAVGLVGFVLLMPYGDVAGRRCETWPVKIAAQADTWEVGAALYRVLFAVRRAPTLNAVIPA